MPLERLPRVRRIRGGLFEVDERDQPKPLTREQKKLINRIIAANDEKAARKVLDFFRKICGDAKILKRRCGGCAGSSKARKGS